MRTYLYIDGFNFYYGCLKDSPFKWLNPAAMAALLLPGHTITAIHYFSANVTARSGDPDQPIRQQTYFRALRTLPHLRIQLGYFKSHQVRMMLVAPPPGGPGTALVWRTDEKGSDVNLATQMLVDGFANAYLQRLEQLLAVRCSTMDGVPVTFLSGEREIVDGCLQLCLRYPTNVVTRTLLVQVLQRMKKARPPVVAEFREKILLLKKEKPLPSPAHEVIERMLASS